MKVFYVFLVSLKKHWSYRELETLHMTGKCQMLLLCKLSWLFEESKVAQLILVGTCTMKKFENMQIYDV